MSLASDQNINEKNLSLISRRMLELRETVFSEWEKRVCASVKGASGLLHPILVNTLPSMYDNLAEALTPDYSRTSAGVTTPSVAAEHGGERARLTRYEAHAVICEYQILRTTIVDVLKQHDVPISDAEMQIISSSFDSAIRESVTAFTLAQSAFREQFVATIAHDLRSPLAAASMANQMIPHVRDFDRINGLAAKVDENLSRIDQMIKDLLDTVMFHRGERLSLHPTNFDIMDVIGEVCEQAVAVYGPRFEMEGTSVRGWWGRDAIKRALENLISNAVKYGARSTTIRIASREYHERVLLSVHNHGEPIPPDQVETVFQVFRRAKADQVETVFQVFRRAKAAREGDQQGWGIGLPYVRSVAESHGGSIDVDSTAERGTTFSIDIPIDARPFQNAPTLQ
ncbi:MAG TPA: HAMP domain-containing sensor histidine kinase [Noviherbaspirillum sp.]|uniref:sensor histidine kinase n=1 Tax=Noviherbaspirillum sp. TaxID=1926288 RepID=UPI002DDD688F|nr:HAMP domain-containing sensor histidine kinase [Noviherbaspirillum sp.]HEV2612612.1 HAMP domain-containing sensor histidine kinase [Noviherbaspirillum sp.]